MPDLKLAAEGIGKIFVGEIIELISTLLIIIAGITAIASISSSSTLAIGGAGIAGTIALILELIGFIITLVGLSKAGKQDQNFKTAFTFIIITIILSVIAGILSGLFAQSVWANIITTICNLFPIIAVLFVVKGCGSVLRKAGDTVVAKSSDSLGTVILILFVAAIIFQFMRGLFSAMPTASTILFFAYTVTVIVAYIMYLSLLSKTKKSLLSR